MQTIGPAAQPPSAEQLVASLKSPIKRVIEEGVNADVESEKSWQIYQARRNALMYRGFQWVAPVNNNGFIDLAPVTGGNLGPGGGGGAYDYSQNIFRGFGRKFIAVLGQRAPNVIAEADDPDDEKGEKASRSANTCNDILDSWWDVDERNLEVAQILWTTGPAFIYTPWNADGYKYGWREEPQYGASQAPVGDAHFHCQNCGTDSPQAGQCPQCSQPLGPEDQAQPDAYDVPEITGVQKYAKGRVECYVENVFTVTTPFYVKKLCDCPWLKYEYDEHRGFLKSTYGDKLKGLNLESDAGTGDSATSILAQAARDAVASPIGSPIRTSQSRWLYTRIWFHPAMFELVKDPAAKQQLKQFFSTGLKITQVQGEIVDLEEEKLDEVWAAVKPETSDTINADPVGADMVSTAMLENYLLNIGAETLTRGISQTLADARVFNFEQYNRKAATPAEVIPVLTGVGENLASSFYQLPAATFSDQMEPFRASNINTAQTNVGVTPEIFGGGEGSSTAREAEIRKNAAMMQLGTPWAFIRKGWEAAKTNGVLQLAKYGPGVVQEGKLMADLQDLADGGWHFSADEAIPSTWGQKRDLLMFMMEKPPEVLQAWGFNRPENIQQAKSLLGMDGWYTPGLDEVNAIRQTIYELLQGQPIQKPKPDGSMDIIPSIPADQFADNHQMWAQFIQGWSQSTAGRTAAQTNPMGYANVLARGKQNAQMAAPPPPPQPPPPPPKLNVTVSADKLPPNQLQAILGDFHLQVPPPQLMPGTQGPPQLPAGQNPGAGAPMPGPAGPPPGPPPAAAGHPGPMLPPGEQIH